MKQLVIAEKPSAARDMARVLHCSQKSQGALEGNQYVVTWGLGHLVTLADPECYDEKYKSWKLEDLPLMPEKLKTQVIGQTGKQFQTVKKLIHRKDIDTVIIATDAGREGELVARLILDQAGNQKPIKRLWISSLTDQSIRNGFSGLKDGHSYDNLYRAALSRAEADWLVGINATRALTCRHNAQLSCGRVQTPTLAIIARREEEIRQFRPKPYYGLQAVFSSPRLTLTWRDGKSQSSQSFDGERINSLKNELEGQSCVIRSIDRKPKQVSAPQLYDLTELQREANQRYQFSAKETLNIMQRLYENYKILTYPRTDSRYLSQDIVDTLPERLKACAVGPYQKMAARLSRQTFSKKVTYVNDAKVSDHHAIIPTEQYVPLSDLSLDERKIYDLVVRRFLAVMYPPYVYEQTTVRAEIGGQTFTAQGQVVKSPGWKAVYQTESGGYGSCEEPEEEEQQQTLPEISVGQTLKGFLLKRTEGKTKPPAYFTEATLLSAMENPVRYMESGDRQMQKTLTETGGLGTVATRADIIEKLFSGFLLEKNGNQIRLTSKGRQLLSLVPQDLKKPELTADWEAQLLKISQGKLKRNDFMRDIRSYARELVDEIKASEGKFTHDNMTNKKCPRCGLRLLAVKGKNSELLVCQDRECGYRETLSRTTNARCPVCHKKMNMIGKGDSQTFVCSCGHKERLNAFKERREREGAGVSKKDVANYMKKQQKEERVGSLLGDLLAQIRIEQ